MKCPKCGTELPDDANYCLKCGTPQKANAAVIENSYETCEIKGEIIKESGLDSGIGEIRFLAVATGPRGRYTAMQSEIIKIRMENNTLEYSADDTNAMNTLNGLIKQLVEAGWESTGRGSAWFKYKFRRMITAS